VGGLLALILCAAIIVLLIRRRRQKRAARSNAGAAAPSTAYHGPTYEGTAAPKVSLINRLFFSPKKKDEEFDNIGDGEDPFPTKARASKQSAEAVGLSAQPVRRSQSLPSETPVSQRTRGSSAQRLRRTRSGNPNTSLPVSEEVEQGRYAVAIADIEEEQDYSPRAVSEMQNAQVPPSELSMLSDELLKI